MRVGACVEQFDAEEPLLVLLEVVPGHYGFGLKIGAKFGTLMQEMSAGPSGAQK
jgi:hypothetical protein